MNGTITIENNGYIVRIKCTNILTEGTEIITDIMNERRINWSAFEKWDDLWYADGAKAIRCTAVDHEEKTIDFDTRTNVKFKVYEDGTTERVR